MAPADALRMGQQLLDDGQPFHAHELFEAVWKATTGPERELWRGLAQLAVGLTHRARGNEVGARALLLRAADTLSVVAGAPYDVAVVALRRWAVTAADDPERAGPIPKLCGQAADDRA